MGKVTVTIPVTLCAKPKALVTRTEYAPPCVAVILASVNVAFVPAGRLVPLNCHWYASGTAPLTSTVTAGDEPSTASKAAGCCTITGGNEDWHFPALPAE